MVAWPRAAKQVCHRAGERSQLRDLFDSQLDPELPRPLTDAELRGLVLMGFPEVALRLTAKPCDECGERSTGAYCAYEHRFPKRADEAPAQPWFPRESRRMAA